MAFPRVVYMDLKPFGDTFTGTSTYRDVAPGDRSIVKKHTVF